MLAKACKPDEFLKEATKRGYYFDSSYANLLKQAGDAGLKLEAVDAHDISRSDREKHLANKVEDILSAEPKSKVLFFVGTNHLRVAGDKEEPQSAGQLLRQSGSQKTESRDKFDAVYIACAQVGDKLDALVSPNHLMRDLKVPMVVSPAKAGFKDMPLNTDPAALPFDNKHKCDRYDQMLFYPAQLQYPGRQQPRERRQGESSGG